ncbi:MAG TPA: hypothetical protein DDZ91_08360 [Firmicutes bacterium]|nr:hypothetical protein [Bacillota bacterium]
MSNDQKVFWERKIIGSLFVLCLFLSSGKAKGVEINNKGLTTPLNLHHIIPVIKTVMLKPQKVITSSRSKMSFEKTQGKEVTVANLDKPTENDHYKIRWGDTFWSIARRYGMSVADLSSLNPGLNPEKIKSGAYLQVKRVAPTSRGRSLPRKLPTPVIRDLSLLSPVSGGRLTSGFGMRWGRMHQGIDLAAVSGTPIRAACQGKVIFAGWKSGYGLLVILDHDDFQTKYAHNSENLVRKGDEVASGELIAKVGKTGNATGNHLHFELLIGGEAVNPLPYLK